MHIKGKGEYKYHKSAVDADAKAVDFGLGLGLTHNLSDEMFVQGRYTMGQTMVFEDVWGRHFHLATRTETHKYRLATPSKS